jgi:hypothetical protein
MDLPGYVDRIERKTLYISICISNVKSRSSGGVEVVKRLEIQGTGLVPSLVITGYESSFNTCMHVPPI